MTVEPGDRRANARSLWLDLLLSTGRLREAGMAVADTVRATTEARSIQGRFHGALKHAWLQGRSGGNRPRLSREEIAPADRIFYQIPALATVAVSLGLAEPLATIVQEHEIDLKGSPSRYVKEELQFARGCLLLIRGDAAGAIGLLEPLARNSILLRHHHVLGRAYEALGRRQEAAAQYEEVLKYPHRKGYLVNPAEWVLDQFRLARIYDDLGDPARARTWYERFLSDWKDADPDVPEIVQARARLLAP